jgi:hypothetical protein
MTTVPPRPPCRRSAGRSWSAPTRPPRSRCSPPAWAGLANEDDISVASGFLSVTVRPWLVVMRGA